MEKKRMSLKNKLTIQILMAVIITLCGLVLIFLGFFTTPIGEISPSVLTAIGETFTFSGSLLGLDYNYKYKSYRDRLKHKYREDIEEETEETE